MSLFNSWCRAFISVFNQPPRSTQPSVLPGSVNENQLRLGRKKQVWFIPLADECGVCRWNACLPEQLTDMFTMKRYNTNPYLPLPLPNPDLALYIWSVPPTIYVTDCGISPLCWVCRPSNVHAVLHAGCFLRAPGLEHCHPPQNWTGT